MSDLILKADEMYAHLDAQAVEVAALRRLIAKERLEIFREQERIQTRQELIIRAESVIEEIEVQQARGRELAAVAREWETGSRK